MVAMRPLCPARIHLWLISHPYSNTWNRNAPVSVLNSNALITRSQCWSGRATIGQEERSLPQAVPASPLPNGLGGQKARGERLFQSLPAKDTRCHQPPAKGLSQPRKCDGHGGGRNTRRLRQAGANPRSCFSVFGVAYDTKVAHKNTGNRADPFLQPT